MSQEISAKQVRPNGFRNPFTFSLRWKVTLSLSILLLLVVGLLFIAFMRYERIFLSRESQKRAQSLANNIVINSRDPLLSQDDLRLGPLIESVSQNSEVQYAYLLDYRGCILYHSNPAMTGRMLPDGVPSPAKGIIQASVPIEVENIKVGTAVVGLGVNHIDQAMMETATGLLLPLGLGAALGILGVFLLAGIHVNRVKRLEEAIQVFMGGPMMGMAQHNLQVPIVKATSGIVCTAEKGQPAERAMPCIRCGTCVSACPMFLLPTRIARLSEMGHTAESEDLGIMNCIECGSCSFVCPSQIPLVQWIRLGKLQVGEMKRKEKEAA